MIKPTVQEDFYLLDLVGGASQTALHPTRPIVAYNSGIINTCFIFIRLYDNCLRPYD